MIEHDFKQLQLKGLDQEPNIGSSTGVELVQATFSLLVQYLSTKPPLVFRCRTNYTYINQA